MKLTKTQTKALDILEDDKTNEILFGGAAGGGKSAIGCYWLLKVANKYPGTRWVMGRKVLKTLKETTLNTFWEICKMQGIKPNIHYTYNPIAGQIKFKNDSEILLKELGYYPSDPEFDSLGSLEITGAFVDEVPQITHKAWNILKSRIRYKLDDYGLVPKILGTGNPSKNWVYHTFYAPSVAGTLDESKVFIQSLLKDNPYISVHYRDNLQGLDKNTRERLLNGNWEYDDDPNSLVSFDAIQDLYSNEHIKEGEAAITTDIAMHGSDKFNIFVWKGFVLVEIISIPKSDGGEVLSRIKETAEKYGVRRSRIVFDSDGLGSFLKGSLLQNAVAFKNGGSPVGGDNYYKLKDQCGYKLAKRINEGGIYIKTKAYKDELVSEVEQLKSYKTDDDTKLKILPKKEIKQLIGHSPDFLDCLIMREYLEVRGVGGGKSRLITV